MIEKARGYLEQADALAPLQRRQLEAVLYNVSLKDSELTSLLRFHHKLSAEQREVVQALVAAAWPRGETDCRTLLSGDQGACRAARNSPRGSAQRSATSSAVRRFALLAGLVCSGGPVFRPPG